MRSLLLILLLATLVVAPAGAQTVQGVVVEEGTGMPVDGAMVILFDSTGDPVKRVLTDGLGRFIMVAEAPGRHSLRVDRIGYESVTSGTFDVGVEGFTKDLAVPVLAVELEGLDVSGSRRCQIRPEDGQMTARIWEEARKALEATAWTQDQGVYRYTLLHYTRDFGPNGHRVVDEQRQFRRGRSQAPYISLPAEELMEEGFVHTLSDGSASYYAPDAEVLLSDPFLDTHCMKLKNGDDGLVGLELEPISGRRTPDIEGTLWLDRTTGHLRSLEFKYVNMRGSPRVNGDPGGEVQFGALPNGTWVVREWRIRMPLIGIQEGTGRMSRVGYRDEGGVVWRVIDSGGTTVLEANTATIAGLVSDSTGVGAVSGVSVHTAMGDNSVTAEDGSFLLTGLAEGLHDLTMTHPSLDTLGLSAPVSVVTAVLGDVARARLRLPSPAQVLDETCGGAPRPDATAIFFARVLQADGAPAPGEYVRLEPLSSRPDAYTVLQRAAPSHPDLPDLAWVPDDVGGAYSMAVTTDARGIFLLCDVPTPAQVRVRVGPQGSAHTRRTFTVGPNDQIEIITITVPEGGDA